MLYTRETPTNENKYLEQTFYLSMQVLTTILVIDYQPKWKDSFLFHS